MKYGAFGSYWVLKDGTSVYHKGMCVQWTRHEDGTLWPRNWEAGFDTCHEAWDYLIDMGRV